MLVPFRANSKRDPRIPAWDWIRQRWEVLLPDAELVVGTDTGSKPFSKSAAVNDAFSRSSGWMLVIADADSWVERDALEEGLEFAARRERLVMPWVVSHRLTKADSAEVMVADPRGPLPVTREMTERCKGDGPSPASAAMVVCLQRTAFQRVGGMDERFRGWGSEDVSFGLACWTLLGKNAFTLGNAYALHHPRPANANGVRVWAGDEGERNLALWKRYRRAQGRPEEMLRLCAEHALPGVPVSVSPELTPDDMVIMPDEPEVTDLAQAPIVRETQGPMMEGDRITL